MLISVAALFGSSSGFLQMQADEFVNSCLLLLGFFFFTFLDSRRVSLGICIILEVMVN